MPYTTEEGGRLNNYAKEPKMYPAEDPTKDQKRNYILLGIAAAALLGGVLFIAVSASSVG